MAKASDDRLLMQEPLIEKHRAPNPHEGEDAMKSPVQPHEDKRNQLEAEKPQVQTQADTKPGASKESAPVNLPQAETVKAGAPWWRWQRASSGPGTPKRPNPHEEDAPVQPHENERNQLEAEKPEPNGKELDSGSLKLLSQESAPLDHEKKIEVEKETPTLASLTEQAREFTKTAAGTSMAAAASAFFYAAEKFAHGEGRKKKVMDTELNKSAMNLSSVAEAAPSSEAGVASIAIKLTSAAQMILLSDNTKPGAPVRWWSWQRGPGTPKRPSGTPKRPSPSLKQQLLRAAIPDRKPMLPIYSDQEKQLVDKRAVLYGLAIVAPVAILTAAAGLHLFNGEWATVAGISAGVWVLAAGGMVMNQYGVFNWELLAARHLGRLGILGAAVLFCFFTYRAFFPSTLWALKLLLIITAIALGLPWILSCVRGDDVAGRADKLEMPPRRHTI